MGCELLQRKNKNQRNWKLDVRRADESELYNVPDDVQLPLLPIELKEAKNNIRLSLEALTPREREVIIFRWGLDPEYYGSKIPREISKKWSNTVREHWAFTTLHGAVPLEELAKLFDSTRERIRQIEATALRKLRHPTRRCRLEGFFNIEPW